MRIVYVIVLAATLAGCGTVGIQSGITAIDNKTTGFKAVKGKAFSLGGTVYEVKAIDFEVAARPGGIPMAKDAELKGHLEAAVKDGILSHR
jgi:hypothetical protein